MSVLEHAILLVPVYNEVENILPLYEAAALAVCHPHLLSGVAALRRNPI